ncbi:uncharacterized protein LOC131146650 [Malania oleifera]|uniref:uncharacterized protein LOC131146650 n=1 Tax=Malania oleifera TaxID=397392 RepID=UPI0025AE6CF7|nr:uncharacterized protein LOC131146650 [Malania oleifera]
MGGCASKPKESDCRPIDPAAHPAVEVVATTPNNAADQKDEPLVDLSEPNQEAPALSGDSIVTSEEKPTSDARVVSQEAPETPLDLGDVATKPAEEVSKVESTNTELKEDKVEAVNAIKKPTDDQEEGATAADSVEKAEAKPNNDSEENKSDAPLITV